VVPVGAAPRLPSGHRPVAPDHPIRRRHRGCLRRLLRPAPGCQLRPELRPLPPLRRALPRPRLRAPLRVLPRALRSRPHRRPAPEAV